MSSLWPPAPPHGAWLAFGLYLIATALFFGRGLLPHPGNTVLGIGTDPVLFQWGYGWYPHALLHGINPLFPHSIFAPTGTNIAQATMVPGPAIVMYPVTALFGPLISFSATEVLAPALAGWTGFLLCRRVVAGPPVPGQESERTRRYREAFVPALVGGWLLGFSSYLVGQLAGHEQLTIVFCVPALAHVMLRTYAGELRRRTSIVALALLLIAQFSVGEEVFASLTLFVIITFIVAYLLGGAEARARLRAMLITLIGAYVIAGIVVSPFLHYSLMPGGEPVSFARSEIISGDLLGLIVPTPIARILGVHFTSTSAHFTAGSIEGGNYLGIPLLVLFVLGVVWGWRRGRAQRVIAAVAFIALVLSLGSHLHVDGHRLFALPWWGLERLPLLGLVLPARLILFLWLPVAVGVALTLAQARGAPRQLIAYLLAAASVAALWPAVGLWRSNPPVPTLFRTSAYKHVIRRGQTVFIPPVGSSSYANLWQADTRFYFNLAGGYVLPAEAPNPYQQWPIYPTLTDAPAIDHAQRYAQQFIAFHHITLTVIGDTDLPGNPWPSILGKLGWSSRSEYGTLVLRPPAGG